MELTRLGLFSLLLVISVPTFATQDELSDEGLRIPKIKFPSLPKEGRAMKDFIPPGWKLETAAEGDLNKDGKNDAVLVLRQNSKRNIVRNDSLGTPELDTNPRLLAVLFAKEADDGYSLMLQEHQLIPRHENPVLDDPFQEVSIGKGSFNVVLRYWASAGSWGTATFKFVFRYENGCFRLIGYDNLGFMRNTMEETTTSINFLTRRIEEINITYDEKGKPVETKKRMRLSRSSPICIDQIGDGMNFQPK